MKRNILIVLFLLIVSASFSQTDENQQALRDELTALSKRVDSLQGALDNCRKNYESNPQKYGSMIVTFESMLFEANQKYAELERKVSQFPTPKSQDSVKTDASFSGDDLADSPFFKNNVSKTDLELFKQSSSVYSKLSSAKDVIDNLYDSLKTIKEKFDKTDSQQEVDNIIIYSENLKKDIVKADQDFNDQWAQLYNSKVDNYLVMLDKLGNISRLELENLDLLSRQAQSSVDPSSTLAPSIADFTSQNKLILAYEELLAEKLGYKNALVKVKSKIKQYESQQSILYPNINFPYRSTAVYENITTGNSYSYTTTNEIPEVKIPSTGVYYSVQLYMSQTQVKSLSTFKGASPLMQFKSGGYYRYLAGGFRTYAEASKNSSAMYKAGFKSPRVIAWLDGTLTTIDKAKANESQSGSGGYIVEVKSSKSSTSTLLKEVLSVHAEGKNWTSTQSGDNTLYRLMTFESKEEAGVIAQIIRTKDSSLEVNVVENE